MVEVITVDNEVAVELAGMHDAVLDALRSRSGCKISLRGNELTLEGDPSVVKTAKKIIEDLTAMVEEGIALTPDMVGVTETSGDHEEQSKTVTQEDFGKVILSHRGKVIGPRTSNQLRYVQSITNNTVTFGVGPAGTGKTFLAMAMAAQALIENRISRIVLTRPAVEAGESLGFLPGTMMEKVDPYLRPLFDALYDMMDADQVNQALEKGVIEVIPLAFMRGRSLNDCFIILDEAQNTSPVQMKMFLTRLGFGSKMVITGDITQIDLPTGTKSGLIIVNDILRDLSDISFIRFEQADVVRHKLVQRIVAAYDTYESRSAR